MQVLLVLFALASCVGRVKGARTPKIIGGWHISIKHAPYHVAVASYDYDEEKRVGTYEYHCGGSIVNEWWILTAAHCIVDHPDPHLEGGGGGTPWPPERLGVAVARDSKDYSRQWMEKIFLRVRSVVPHAQFMINSTRIYYDIGLLRLQRRPLVWGARIQPVVLPAANFVPREYGHSCVAGFGRVSPFGLVKDNRLKGHCGHFAEHSACAKYYHANVSHGPPPKVCWPTRVNNYYARQCSGDSGNGLVSKMSNGSFLIIGVMSGGGRFCSREDMETFTLVSYYRSWITSVIEDTPRQRNVG